MFMACSVELVKDNRANIYGELFGNSSDFDFELFEAALNHKFSKPEADPAFYAFVEKVGGSCNDQNQCKVPIYATFCIAETAIITIESDHFIVEKWTDGC